MFPAGEWLEDFAIDVDRILVLFRLREQVQRDRSTRESKP
jgi:hypothetical protein